MGKVILGFTMSLDGFISDRNESVADLYHDLETLRYAKPLQESIRDTGAVVMGRRTFEMGEPDAYAENYEYQVPIFVVTIFPPEKQPRKTDQLKFTFVAQGVESAIQQAKAAAGNKDVTIVGGAEMASQSLNAGLVDEIHIDIMPIVFGMGLQPFTGIRKESIKLEKISVVETSVRTHLKFRVIK